MSAKNIRKELVVKGLQSVLDRSGRFNGFDIAIRIDEAAYSAAGIEKPDRFWNDLARRD
jgi:hypothetical protein